MNIIKIAENILTAASACLIAGCGSVKYSFPDPDTNSREGSYVSRPGTFETKSGKYSADFGTITVPENRDNSASRLIHLPVIRIHSLSADTAEPVFYLAGGPGQSNIECIPLDTLLVRHDFVMVGYRGVDGSVRLDCPEIVDVLKGSEDPLAESSLKKLANAWEAVAGRFAKEGIDWNGYTIPQTIEDMESVRRAFNYRRINLQSESFGTRIAYLYGLMHPQSIHRSVMIGVNPPGCCMWDPRTVDEQLGYYGRLWAEDSANSARCPDLIGTMRKVLRTLPKKWLFFSINPGKVKIVTFCMLFHRNTSALVFDAFVEAANGDYSGLALLSMAYNYIIPSLMVWGEVAPKALSADLDSAKIRLFTDDSSSVLGSPLNKLLWGSLLYSKSPIRPIPEELRTPQPSDVETLMLSGSVDFSDPPKYATQELLPYLHKGRQIILSECGHVGDLIYLRKQSTKRILASYFSTGIPDTSLIEYVPMDFNIKWSMPTIAKVGVGTIAVIGTVAIVGIILLFKNGI
jgi:pimeloyl-ACP methyl ester carboxylesterase